LDKTGTVTSGRMQVRRVEPAPGVELDELLANAAALEENSEHPVAQAVREYTAALNLNGPSLTGFEALPGNGVRAVCEKTGRELLGGSVAFMESRFALDGTLTRAAEELSEQGCTPLCFARGGQVLGLVAVADTPRPSSKEAIRRMKEMGLRVVMLTGDNRRTAAAVAAQVGIEEVIAQVLPGDKEAQVRRLQQEGRVAMVGDGINDAPALTRADLGVAIGAGTDVAIDAADLVLMQSDLLGAARAIRLGRAVLGNIRQNLFWAFCYNTVGIPVAAGCFAAFGLTLNPMLGAAAMSLSSFCVVSNALRLNFANLDKGGLPAEEPVLPAAPAAEEDTTPQENETTEKGETTMTTKTIKIEGMMCMHCRAHVDKALNGMEGVEATVDLEAGKAVCQVAEGVTDEALTACITEAGYTVTGIE
ncbi:MAG: metal-transporting ATPase, partial [Oscillospiraceae bacterium]|nr:metal-transporting ATPase [Oscillospiraceae bacterium]